MSTQFKNTEHIRYLPGEGRVYSFANPNILNKLPLMDFSSRIDMKLIAMTIVIQGKNWLRPLKNWDHGLGSHRYRSMSVSFCIVFVLCRYRQKGKTSTENKM
jgi:hypothetical protein